MQTEGKRGARQVGNLPHGGAGYRVPPDVADLVTEGQEKERNPRELLRIRAAQVNARAKTTVTGRKFQCGCELEPRRSKNKAYGVVTSGLGRLETCSTELLN